jgi:Mrp family chromosome partitioning ATPase
LRFFLHRAGFFWRGGSVVAGVVFAIFLCIAFAMSPLYETEAVVGLGLPAADSVGALDRARAVMTETERLAGLARSLTPELPTQGAELGNAVERVRQSIEMRLVDAQHIGIAFRADTREKTQRGANQIADTVAERLAAQAGPAPERESKESIATRELAAFVAQHPDVALNKAPPKAGTAGVASAEASGTKAAAPPADSAMVVLQQQRASLEARLAALGKEAAPSEANPYDRPSDHPDRAAIQRMLADVKNAIAARQNATQRAGTNPAPAPGPSASAGASAALQTEWQRLLQAVVDAQQAPPPKPAAQAPVARVAQQALLPASPVRPNRPLLLLVGMAGGLWMGVFWAFARVALGHDRSWRSRAARGDATEAAEKGREPSPEAPVIPPPPGVPSGIGPPPAAQGEASLAAFLQDGLRSLSPSGTRSSSVRPPPALRVTQKGVIDVATVLAQTGRIAESALPSVQAAPIMTVGESAAPIVASGSSHAPRPANDPPRGRSDQPRPPSDPPRAPSDPPRTTRSAPPGPDPAAGSSRPPPRQYSKDTAPRTQSFGSPVPPRPPSDPPGTFSTALAVVKPSTSYSMVRREVPDDIVAPRDTPANWAPDPRVRTTDSVDELRALRDQLYTLATRGCFVVGVSSAPEAASAKSRVAAQLALLLAESTEARVLLMEADFDHPSVHRLMKVDMPLSSGFSQQMHKRLNQRKRSPWALVRCSASLHVLGEGLVRAPGLLSSVPFREAVAELRQYYDLIVADGPFSGASVDTKALDTVADGLVLVVREGQPLPKVMAQASKWFSQKELMAVVSAKL